MFSPLFVQLAQRHHGEARGDPTRGPAVRPRESPLTRHGVVFAQFLRGFRAILENAVPRDPENEKREPSPSARAT